MPKIAKNSASRVESMEGFEGRYEELGGYTVGFESFGQDMDAAAFFKGLPDDRCSCPHWGIVRKGKLGFRYADREETISEGEAYYAEPGHTPVMYAGSEVVEFSPTEELHKVMEVVTRNFEEA